MEKEVVSGVTYDRDQAKITVVHVPDRPGVAASLFTALSEHHIVVDMIIQNASLAGFYGSDLYGIQKRYSRGYAYHLGSRSRRSVRKRSRSMTMWQRSPSSEWE